MVLYYMLTGELAFGMTLQGPPGQQPGYKAASFDDHIAQIQAGPPLAHPALNGPDGERIQRLLRWLLAFNPHDRPTITQLRNSPCTGCQWFREGLDRNPFAQQHGQGPVQEAGPDPQLVAIVQVAQGVLGGGQPVQQPQAMAMG